MIKGKSIVDSLKEKFPETPRSKEFYEKQVEIWTKAVQMGLDNRNGILTNLIEHYKNKVRTLEKLAQEDTTDLS